MKKTEVVEILAKTLGLLRHLYSEYAGAKHYDIPEVRVGDWAIERTYMGQFPIEAIIKITGIGGTSYSGIDLLGEKRSWSNAFFEPLPKHCQDYLNGVCRW